MINIIQKPQIKIYRNGNYDRVATWKPVLQRQVVDTLLKMDYWISKHEWPSTEEARSVLE